LEEPEWVIGRQMNYAGCKRRHSGPDYRSPMEYLIMVVLAECQTLFLSRGGCG